MGAAVAKFLVVGDPHIRPEDITEGERLIGYVAGLVRTHKPDHVVITGDLYHYHGIVHVQVMEFWRRSIQKLLDADRKVNLILLRGNHDAPHDVESDVNALISHKDQDGRVFVIDEAVTFEIRDELRVLFVPYTHNPKDFVGTCNSISGVNLVYCHQTFNGGKYENGFYAQDGVNPEDIPQTQVVSGHIHAPQEFGKVWYVGSPRWITSNDANQDRMVWLVEHDVEGRIVNRQSFEMDKICSPIITLEDTPESPASDADLQPNYKVFVTIRGPGEWCQERKNFWQGKARYRTLPTSSKRVAVRESEGISTAFRKYLEAYRPELGTSPEVLASICKERLNLLIQV